MRLVYSPRSATWTVLLCGSPVLWDGRASFRSYFDAVRILNLAGCQVGTNGEIY
jgi:hypothetical protein